MFKQYIDKGFNVVPRNGKWFPVKWSVFNDRYASGAECAVWEAENYSTELVCGKISGVVALDIDTDDVDVIAAIEAIAGKSPIRRYGSKGYAAFYKYNGARKIVWKRDGAVVAELIGDNHLCAIPPARHRETGRPYQWIEGDLLTGDLPALPDDFVERMDSLFPRKKYDPKPIEWHVDDVLMGEAEEMLGCISADCARDEWISIGMALQSEYGDSARDLWHKWSQEGAKYNYRDAEAAWRSFGGDGITIGTLVHRAKEGGYIKTSTVDVSEDLSGLEDYFRRRAEGDDALSAHGLVGDIAEWITATAWKPQPKLSLAAAITLVACLKGKKYKTSTDVFSNVYCLNIASSGSGKDWPQKAIKGLSEDLFMPPPASNTGFIDDLAERGGHGFLCLDEMADWIATARAKGMTHKGQIFRTWLELYSSAKDYYMGERRADSAKENVKRIDNPMFCMMASSTKEKLTDAMSSDDISGGLLNRFLFFTSDDQPRKRKYHQRNKEPFAAQHKIDAYLLKNSYNAYDDIIKVRFARDAYDYYDKIDDHFEDELQSIDDENKRHLYGRAHEYVGKLALILCDDIEIQMRDVECAFKIVKSSMRDALAFSGDIAINANDADYIRVRNIIMEQPQITRAQLTRRCQFLTGGARRLSEIVANLDELGQLRVVDGGNGGKVIKRI